MPLVHVAGDADSRDLDSSEVFLLRIEGGKRSRGPYIEEPPTLGSVRNPRALTREVMSLRRVRDEVITCQQQAYPKYSVIKICTKLIRSLQQRKCEEMAKASAKRTKGRRSGKTTGGGKVKVIS